MTSDEPTREASTPSDPGQQDPVGAARREEREADRVARSGRLDEDTLRELEIAVEQLRADLTNGENPEASVGRIRRLVARARPEG